MSPNPDFERFSRALDDEWLRGRLRSVGAPGAGEEGALFRDLQTEDPLAEARGRGWREGLRGILGAWPGRVAFATAVVLLVAAGFLLGRFGADATRERVVVAVPPVPAWEGERRPGAGLAAAPAVRPESERKLLEAMAFHDAPDFSSKALPLLRAAVASDPSNDQAQFWLGVVLLRERKGGEAVAPLEEAVRLAPASVRYKEYLVFAYLQTGATAKAQKVQAEVLKGR